MPGAAAVWVDVLPSMRGFGGELIGQVSDSAATAGERAGNEIGENTKKGFSGHVAKIAAVGAVVGTALVGAISKSMDLEAANSKLKAQLGLSAPEAARFGKLAGDLYSQNYGDSMEDVNGALAAVRQNISGMATASDADLSGMSANALNLSSAFGIDVVDSTRAVGQMLKTGMAPNAQAAFDILTKGMQNGVNQADDLLDTFSEYSTQFRKLGLDGQAATGLLQQGLKGGARDADQVADALKEFSIRAVDGSTTSAAGFKALGLNAAAMTKQIAGGGAGASAGLDMVLDKLRAMKDPVKQSAAATALFGTQAEDLGAALFSLDPSSAVSTLGKVAGSATQLGTDLSDNATSRIASFRKGLEMNVTSFIGGTLLPGLEQAGTFVTSVFGPAFDVIGPILTPIAPQLVAVGAGLGGLVVAGKGIGLAKDAIGGVRDTVSGLVGQDGAIRKLGGAWESIRGGATVAGDATKAAAGWVADTGKKAATAALDVGRLALGYASAGLQATISAGRQVGAAVASGVVTAATWAWGAAQTALNFVLNMNPIGLVIIGITLLVGAVIFAYTHFQWFRDIVAGAWSGIQIAAQWAWANVLQPTFAGISAGVQAVGSFFLWLYLNAVLPAWSGIQTAASIGWGIISMIFGWLQLGLRAAGAVFTWLYLNAVQPAWIGIQTAASVAWGIVQSIFGFFASGVDGIGRAFESVAAWIGRSWDSVREAARAPVQWVVDVVYNNGIRALWNGIAGIFGMDELPTVTLAAGGMVPAQPMITDGPMAIVGEGRQQYPEYVIPTDPRYRGRAQALWGAAGSKLQMLEGGGVVGFFGDLFSAGPVDAVKGLFSSVLGDSQNTPGGGAWREALVKLPVTVIDSVIDKAKSFVDGLFGGGGAAGGQLGQWIGTAMAIAGVPASWAAPLNTLIMRESGGNPNAINLWDSNAQAGHPSQGLMQTIPSTFAANRDPRLPNSITDPIANIVAGIHYIQSRYGSIFNVQQAVGSTPKGYDSGGWLEPGYSSVFNGTGKPEAILTGQQWSAIASGTRGGDGPEELTMTSGQLEIVGDGLVRIVDARLQRTGTRISTGRRT